MTPPTRREITERNRVITKIKMLPVYFGKNCYLIGGVMTPPYSSEVKR